MGIYVYNISTASRKIIIDDVAQDVYPLKYSRKETMFGYSNNPKFERMRQARMERLRNIWSCLETPKYIAWGDFSDAEENDINVYSGWGHNQISITDGSTNELYFEGTIRKIGRKLIFTKWYGFTLPDHLKYVEECYEYISKIIKISPETVQIRTQYDNRVVHVKEQKDAALIKMFMENVF